jgi:long-chain acyl-CoA synthetase
MDRIWLGAYPPGVPAEIDVSEYASINDMLSRACRKFAGRPAFTNFGVSMTYDEVDRLSRDFAAWLQTLPGLPKGSRIALMMPNLMQYPIALFGALRAGMMVVNVNPLYTARELENQLRDCGAKGIVILENFAHVLQGVLPRTTIEYVVTTGIGDLFPAPKRWLTNFAVRRVKKMVPAWRIDQAVSFKTALHRGAQAKWNEPSLTHDDIAFLQYTGGTTGVSKGAILTHGNIVANVLQGSAWTSTVMVDGRDTMVTALPLYHIFSLTTNCLLCMEKGGNNLLITNPRDMRGFVKQLGKSRFTVITGVNTLFNSLLNTPGFTELDFSELKIALGGGAAIQRVVAERWRQVTGCPIVQGYGLTETSPFVACSLFNAEYDGAVGPPVPSTDVCILDQEDRELAVGQEGEICVRGPQVMGGYWQRPQETESAFTAGGWLRTGDIGLIDERGFLHITDRKKDMILVSGFNVYPNEVESVIAAHPGVAECAVIGVPDAVSGEAVKAFIVRRDSELTPESVIAFCRQGLTNYKVPRQIEFRGELPKNQIGKVLRRELRPVRGKNTDLDIARQCIKGTIES